MISGPAYVRLRRFILVSLTLAILAASQTGMANATLARNRLALVALECASRQQPNSCEMLGSWGPVASVGTDTLSRLQLFAFLHGDRARLVSAVARANAEGPDSSELTTEGIQLAREALGEQIDEAALYRTWGDPGFLIRRGKGLLDASQAAPEDQEALVKHARGACEMGIRLASGEAPERVDGLTCVAESYLEVNDESAAAAVLDKLLAVDSTNSWAAMRLALIGVHTGSSLRDIAPLLQIAAAENCEEMWACLLLGESWLPERSLDALSLFLRAGAAHSESEWPMIYQARAFISLGRTDEADSALTQAEARNANQPAVYFFRSYVLQARGDLSGARAAIRECDELSPGYPGVTNRLRELGGDG